MQTRAGSGGRVLPGHASTPATAQAGAAIPATSLSPKVTEEALSDVSPLRRDGSELGRRRVRFIVDHIAHPPGGTNRFYRLGWGPGPGNFPISRKGPRVFQVVTWIGQRESSPARRTDGRCTRNLARGQYLSYHRQKSYKVAGNVLAHPSGECSSRVTIGQK